MATLNRVTSSIVLTRWKQSITNNNSGLRRVLLNNNNITTKQQQQQQYQIRFMGSDHGVPVPQSSKAVLFAGHPKKEGWESTIAWWYSSSFILIVLVLNTTPDTSIESWAQQEARARLALKDKGFTDFQFGTHYYNLTEGELKSAWDTLSNKATKMNDDDDDDDDEEDEEDGEGADDGDDEEEDD